MDFATVESQKQRTHMLFLALPISCKLFFTLFKVVFIIQLLILYQQRYVYSTVIDIVILRVHHLPQYFLNIDLPHLLAYWFNKELTTNS